MENADVAKKTSLRTAVKEGMTEIVVREGDAAIIREKNVLDWSGTITSPREWWENRVGKHKMHKPKFANVIFSKFEKRIELTVNENSHFNKKVKGKLLFNEELVEFGINGKTVRSIRDLAEFLRMRRFYFPDRDQATAIIANLMKFKVRVDQEIVAEKDNRGNVNESILKKVTTDLATDFTLEMPIFKGQPKRKFKVDVEFDIRDRAVSVWLVSEELREIELKDTEDIFMVELKPFKEADVVCIEQ